MAKIFLVNHATSKSGSANYFEDYLLRKQYTVLRVSHPLLSYENQETQLLINKKVQQVWARKSRSFLNLFEDWVLTIKILRKYCPRTYIGANNFDTLCGILCKRVFRMPIERIIYFGSDFSENRYQNRLLNRIYLLVEKLSLRYSNLIISNTHRAERRRVELGMSLNKSIVIPNGIYIENPVFIKKNIKKDKFVYVGSISPEHGLLAFLESTHSIIRHLTIIGHGENLNKVLALCKKYQIKHVVYKHKPHKWVLDFLSDFEGFGLAPYNDSARWTYYCSPTKMGEYIASGIPVITSDRTEASEIIEESKLGIRYIDLDLKKIKIALENFDTKDFEKKALLYYESHKRDSLYAKIPRI